MKRLKFFMVGISAIFVLGIPILNNTDNNLEAATSTFTAPALSINNKVKVANKNYTVIGIGSDVKLLADASEGDSLTWNAAQAKLTYIPASYGTLANTILTNKFTQPTTTDLASFRVGDALNGSIPTLTNNWWLGDASVDNRSKYITKDNNSYIGKNKIKDTAAGATCDVIKETEEVGIFPTVEEVGEAGEAKIVDYDTINIKTSLLEAVNLTTGKPIDKAGTNELVVMPYTSKDCTTGASSNYWNITHRLYSGDYSFFVLSKNGNLFVNNNSGNNYPLYSPSTGKGSILLKAKVDQSVLFHQYINAGINDFVPRIGDEYEETVSKNKCYKLDVSPSDLGDSNIKPAYSSYRVSGDYRGKIRVDDVTYDNPIYGDPCPGQDHYAGTASLRPMITVLNKQILLNNTNKRTYEKALKLEDNVPSSDTNGSYLTLLSQELKAELDPLNENVKDNVLSIVYDSKDTVITIPVSSRDVKEGNSFVSASTKDIDGNDIYGVIGNVNGTQANVALDVSNLLKDGERSLNLTLYQEDSGVHDTSYMSEGTPITINLLSSQSIAFDEGQTSSIAYGDTVTITSSLKTSVAYQADTDITYRINEGQANVVSQSYDKTTGKATAVIKANAGSGEIEVAIEKAGSPIVTKASTVIHKIELKKKELTIHPTKPSKVYTKGETMPALTSTNSGLVSGDTLPSGLDITLLPLAGTEAAFPATSDTIDAIGKWKMTYASSVELSIPEAFSKKYKIIFQDYDDENTYVFETMSDVLVEPSDLSVIAQSDSVNISSNTWVKMDVIFTISDGSLTTPVTGYQVAVTSGTKPQESDWKTLSDPTNNKHLVSSEQKGKHYFFRSLPDKVTSTAFVVNIDKTAPTDVAITLRKKNSGPVARMFNLMSFGNWLKEEQAVSLSASDNLSSASELKMYYAEEKNGVMGTWKLDTKTLSYKDVDIILHAKAVDLAGNETVASEFVKIDLLPPSIQGVKDQSVYKQYYLPRFISVSDEGSGVKSATYTKDGGSPTSINLEEKFTDAGVYNVEAEDGAGNTISITFKIVPLPDLEDIDGSDESKDIIDQIQKELDEIKNKIDKTESDEYEEWLKDANDKWDSLRKTVIENDDKTSKVEGVGDTNFDPKVELIVDPIEESTLPKLPRKALYSYDVYLRKGMTIIQPNGDVKVYLPYPDKADPIVYEIGKARTIREIPAQKEGDSVVFVTRVLQKYAISNMGQELEEIFKVPGPDGEMDTSDDVIANPNDKGELPVKNPDGSITLPNGGSVTYPNGTEIPTPEGGKLLPDGSLILPDGTQYDPEGNLKPEPEPEVDKDINIDSDGDGKPDVNVDVDCDGKADINIDTDGDGIPDINIDTTGDGKPNYNVDLDGDLIADLNIGPVRWKADKCVSGGCVLYCTSTFYKPYLNIDTDGDMRPDVNVDLDKDNFADINIDIDLDHIPDIDIDSDGDGKADINVDTNDDGRPDKNLALMSKWVPDKNVDAPIAYDTMSGIVVDETLTPDTWHPSNKGNVSNDGNTNNGNSNTGGIGGSNTGDATSTIAVWILFIISGCMSYVMHRIKKQQKRKFR